MVISRSCPASRLSMVPESRERTIANLSVSIKVNKEYRESKELELITKSIPESRKVKTAPPVRINSQFNKSVIFRRQPSKPEVRPFSETRKLRTQSVPNSPNTTTVTRSGQKRGVRDRAQSEYFKDRSYMSDVYSWARASEAQSCEQIKGMELTASILNYKPEQSKRKFLYQSGGVSENEDPLRSGLGYEGYMDCLLRGRRHRLNRKPCGITSDLITKSEPPTLVPMNSMVRE